MRKYSYREIGEIAKTKWPQYSHLDGETVGRQTVEKMPQYKQLVADPAPTAEQSASADAPPVESPRDPVLEAHQAHAAGNFKEAGIKLTQAEMAAGQPPPPTPQVLPESPTPANVAPPNPGERIRSNAPILMDDEGMAQMQAAAAPMAGKLATIYVDGSERTKQAAVPFMISNPQAEVKIIDSLGPHRLGALTGADAAQAQGQINTLYRFPDQTPPGGESVNAYAKRTIDAQQKIVSEATGKPGLTAIITHSSTASPYDQWVDSGSPQAMKVDSQTLQARPKDDPGAVKQLSPNVVRVSHGHTPWNGQPQVKPMGFLAYRRGVLGAQPDADPRTIRPQWQIAHQGMSAKDATRGLPPDVVAAITKGTNNGQ